MDTVSCPGRNLKLNIFKQDRLATLSTLNTLNIFYDNCMLLLWGILVMWLECRFLDTEVDGSNPGISM